MSRPTMTQILCAIALAMLVLPADSYAASTRVDQSFDVEPGQELRLAFEGVRGDIVVEGWDKNQVQVTGQMRGRDWEEDDEIEFDHTSSGVDVAPSYHGHRDDRISADLKIMVPRRFDIRVHAAADTRVEGVEGEVELSIANASAELIDVHGQGDINTANGKLRVKRCTFDGDISSVNGGLEMDDSEIAGEVSSVNGGLEVSRAPDGLEVSSVNGSVDVEAAGGHVDAKTTNGRIRIRELHGRITASTVNGGVRFRMVGNADNDRTVDIETLNGTVEIEIPENFSLDFDIEVRDKDRHGRYEIISDFDLDVETDESRRGKHRIRGTGKIGGGKHAVHIRATNGDVILKKIAAAR